MHARNGRLLVLVLTATALAVAMMLLTKRAMTEAIGGAKPSVASIELSWNGHEFDALTGALGAASRNALADAHYIDDGFALAYSIALGAWLVWLSRLDVLSGSARWLGRTSWAGFSAGAFDLVENACLRRCLRDPCLDAAKPSCLAALDGPLHIAAIMASIKFALAGIALVAILVAGAGAVVSIVRREFR